MRWASLPTELALRAREHCQDERDRTEQHDRCDRLERRSAEHGQEEEEEVKGGDEDDEDPSSRIEVPELPRDGEPDHRNYARQDGAQPVDVEQLDAKSHDFDD